MATKAQQQGAARRRDQAQALAAAAPEMLEVTVRVAKPTIEQAGASLRDLIANTTAPGSVLFHLTACVDVLVDAAHDNRRHE